MLSENTYLSIKNDFQARSIRKIVTHFFLYFYFFFDKNTLKLHSVRVNFRAFSLEGDLSRGSQRQFFSL